RLEPDRRGKAVGFHAYEPEELAARVVLPQHILQRARQAHSGNQIPVAIARLEPQGERDVAFHDDATAVDPRAGPLETEHDRRTGVPVARLRRLDGTAA